MSDPGAPDVPRSRGIDLGELGLDVPLTDNDVLYQNLMNGDDLHRALARFFTGRRKPTENEVYRTVRDFRDWLVRRKPYNWSAFKDNADSVLATGKARSDSRSLAALQAAKILDKIGVPEVLVKNIVSLSGIPKREKEVAMSVAYPKEDKEKKGRGRPMYA